MTKIDGIEKTIREASKQMQKTSATFQKTFIQIAEFSKQMQRPVKTIATIQNTTSLLPALENIGKVFIEASKMTEKAAFNFQQTINKVNSYGEVFKKMQEEGGAFASAIKQNVELFKRLRNAEKTLRKKLKNDKLFLIPYFDDEVSGRVRVYELFLEHKDKKAIEVYHEFFSQEENIQGLLKRWDGFRRFKTRNPIIKKALKAHLNQDYELSIPVLVAQFEGIIREVTNTHGKRFKEVIEEIKNKSSFWFDEDMETFHQIVEQDIFKTISTVCPNFKKEFKKLNYANRHLVQHGYDIDYYKNPTNSTRAILLLDFLTLYMPENGKR